MNIITGEKFQQICNHNLSTELMIKFEYHSEKYINVREFDFTNFDNREMVFINNNLFHLLSLQRINKKSELKEVNMFEILSQFKNPFNLILHNNDSPFTDDDLIYFDIPNCKKIYTQNTMTYDKRVIPIPIGIANSCWKWGDLSVWENVKIKNKRNNFVYFNFQVEGGCRDQKRPDCYESISSQGIEWLEMIPYNDYIENLSTYEFSVCPEGNGIDTHRLWESLYLKVIPIVDKSPMTEHFSKWFPMVLVDDWKTFDVNDVKGTYNDYNWENYHLLDFDKFCKKVGL